MTEQKTLSTLHLILCALFAALIAVGSFLRINIPPVAITLQTFFTTMAGMILGKKLGSISVAVYILIGLLGVPVFTSGGGPGSVLTLSFGYLLGALAGAFFCGWWIERKHSHSIPTLLVACLGNIALIYLFGCTYAALIAAFYQGTPIAAGKLLFSYFLIFMPGDCLKMLVAILVCRTWLPHFRRLAHIPL